MNDVDSSSKKLQITAYSCPQYFLDFVLLCELEEIIFIYFFNVYLFLRQRETEHERGRVRERETQNLKQAPGSELSAHSPTWGSNSRAVRS